MLVCDGEQRNSSDVIDGRVDVFDEEEKRLTIGGRRWLSTSGEGGVGKVKVYLGHQ